MWYTIDMNKYQARHKQYHIDNREKLNARSRQWRIDNRDKQRNHILSRLAGLYWYKVTKGCADCGSQDYRTLELDHVPELADGTPRRTVTGMMQPDTLAHELAKCEVVCANCHSIRTYMRRLDNRPEICYTSK